VTVRVRHGCAASALRIPRFVRLRHVRHWCRLVSRCVRAERAKSADCTARGLAADVQCERLQRNKETS